MPGIRAILMLAIVWLATPLCAQKYEVTLDLASVTKEKDRVKVTVITPAVTDEKIVYALPALIPGSYSRKDFGRFVHEFYALDAQGYPLKVKKLDNNRILIKNPHNRILQKIGYWVDDTWDAQKTSPKQKDAAFNYIFQPGGTNIDAGRNYVINHQGFYGYLVGYEKFPYELTILKTGNLFGSTTADISRESPGRDVITAPDYATLVDNPVMYCEPDTAVFSAGDTRVTISVFSENRVVKAEKLRRYLLPLSGALNNFFGKMPVDRYMFIFYFTRNDSTPLTRYGGYGALEHNYCSFYFLPELSSENSLKSMVMRVAAHEFLHILTPLNIHSEEIQDFDFQQPKMSQHLWLYEGVTEYFAHLAQLRDSMITDEEFIKVIRGKIQEAAGYRDVSFTHMSRNILQEDYRSMYSNVYEKGALIAFLLDIRLMELSKGKMNLRDLLFRLSEKYGPEKPFKDDSLITEIVRMTYPEIGKFFNDYVIGSKPLPYQDYFSKIGWNYYYTKQDSVTSFGKFGLFYNQTDDAFIVTRCNGENRFGLKNGDRLLSINDKPITYKNFEEVLDPVFSPWGNLPVTVRYRRGGEEMSAAARPDTIPVTGRYVIEENPALGLEKTRLRQKMFSNYFKE